MRSSRDRRRGRRRTVPALPALAGLACALVLEAIFLLTIYLPAEKQQAEALWRTRLWSLSDDRQRTIETWLEDRKRDAALLGSYPTLFRLAQDPMRAAADGHGSTAHAGSLLDQVALASHYAAGLVIDVDGRVVLRKVTASGFDPDTVARYAQQIASSRHRTGFHRDASGKPWLIFAAPLTGSGESEGIAGTTALVVDPHQWLYPTIRRDPGPSRTVEPLLVQSELGFIRVLSPLRLARHEALAFRFRPGTTGVSAQDGSIGWDTDYRGQTVLAALRPVKGSPWTLAIKLDRDEVFADVTASAVRLGIVLTLITVIASVALFALLSTRRFRHEAQLAQAEGQFWHLFQSAHDAILVVEPDGRISSSNARAERLYGIDAATFRTMWIDQIWEGELRQQIVARLLNGGTFEAVHVGDAGRRIQVEVSASVLENQGASTIAIIRDISRRKADEDLILSLNRLLRTTWEVTRLTMRNADACEFFDETCRILVNDGGFDLAWIGAVAEEERIVTLSSSEASESKLCREESSDGTTCVGVPVRQAIAAQKPVVINDWSCPASAVNPPCTYRSVAAFPLDQGRRDSAIGIYSNRKNAFPPEVVELLADLVSDLTFALSVAALEREKRLVVEALARSEEEFRTVVESAPETIFIQIDGRFEYVNTAGLQLLGAKDRSELIGRRVLDFVHVDSRRAITERIDLINQWSLPVPPLEERWHRIDGSTVAVEASAVPFSRGNAKGALVFLRDLTERLAEMESSRRLTAAVEQASDSIMITDIEGRIEYVNPAFRRIYGFRDDEVIGEPIDIIRSGAHDEHFYRAMWETILSGESWHGEFINRTRTGELIEEEATISPIRDTRGEIVNFVAVKRDIRQEKRLETQLRHAQKMEAVGNLAGGVAHDFNNLLQAFASQLQVLRRRRTPDDLAQAVSLLEEQVRRGSSLTRQLLLFSRRDAAKVETFELNAALDATTRMLRHLLRENIDFRTVLDDRQIYIRGDRGEIEQVLMNLVVNASQAMPDGGKLTVTSTMAGTGWCRVRVEDTGTGIDPSVIDRIFEPFFTTKPAGQGTGLGLAVVHGIVKRAGGAVAVETEPGKGSAFTISLPLAQSEAVPFSEIQPEPASGEGQTILLIEDDEPVREGLSALLALYQYEVVAVASAEAARGVADSVCPAVLLSDVVLPETAGPAIAQELVRRWPAMRVILMSGYTEQHSIPDTLNGFPVELLRKPFSSAELLGSLERLLRAPATPS